MQCDHPVPRRRPYRYALCVSQNCDETHSTYQQGHSASGGAQGQSFSASRSGASGPHRVLPVSLHPRASLGLGGSPAGAAHVPLLAHRGLVTAPLGLACGR